MTLFNKIVGGSTLFNKITRTPNLLRKIDNSVARVGSFLQPTLNHFGMGALGNVVGNIVRGAHAIKNNLEKSIHTPMNEIRDQTHYV